MKTVQVSKAVRNVDGLFEAFKKADPPFGILSVGVDPRTTYVYLEDHETRDPAPIVQAWVDEPELRASATGQVGMMGIVEALANGVDVHTVLIQKVDPSGGIVAGDEKLSVTVPDGLALSDKSPRLSDGMVMIQVGPSSKSGDFTVTVSDRAGKMRAAKLPLRFVSKMTDGEPDRPPAIEKQGGVMAAIRRWLGL